MKRVIQIFALILLLVLGALTAGATTRYVSQGGGTFTGGTACNGQTAISLATFNATTNSPNDLDYLCGTITSAVSPIGNGTSGNPVTIKFDTGASIQMPALPTTGAIVLTSLSYYLIDGGGGSCGYVSNANSTCAVGFIESTANGSGLANQIASVAINGNSTTGLEVKGLLIGPVYSHTSTSDLTQSPPGPLCISLQSVTSANIHNNTMHDAGWCLTGTAATLTVQNNEIYNVDHGLGFGGTNSSFTVNANHIHSFVNWDTSNNSFHHDGIHLFSTGTNTFNGATISNNLFDGDQGANLTSPGLYAESASSTGTIENLTVFDNVIIMYPGRLSCCGLISFYTTASGGTATTAAAYNNTLIGYYFAGTGACLDVVGWKLATVENNTITGCQNLITVDSVATISAINYNEYQNLFADECGAACNTFSWHGTITPSFTTWKTDCSCDASGRTDTLAAINVNASGQQLGGSTLIGNGLNLTSLSIPALDSDFLGVSRPGVAAWDIGAYFGIPSLTSVSGVGGAGGIGGVGGGF